MNGRWEGTLYQDEALEGDPIDVPITICLKSGRKKIIGTARFKFRDVENTLDLTGGFITQQYLTLHYKRRDPRVIQYGLAILKFDAYAKTCTGKYVSYSPSQEKIASGKVELKKLQQF